MFPGKKSKASLYLLFILIFLWAIAVTGCSATSDEMSADFTEELSTNAAEEGGETGGEDAVRSTAPNQAGEKNASPAKPRFIIYTGSLELTVRDTRKTVEEIRQITAGEGGLVSESRIYESQKGQFAADLSLRIPETRFDDFIAQLEELGEAANVRKSSEDVTLSYLDLETRIKNLKTSEKRLLEILAEAGTVEEILTVEQETGDFPGPRRDRGDDGGVHLPARPGFLFDHRCFCWGGSDRYRGCFTKALCPYRQTDEGSSLPEHQLCLDGRRFCLGGPGYTAAGPCSSRPRHPGRYLDGPGDSAQKKRRAPRRATPGGRLSPRSQPQKLIFFLLFRS